MLSAPIAAGIAAGVMMAILFAFMTVNARQQPAPLEPQYISQDEASEIIGESYERAQYTTTITPEFGSLRYNATFDDGHVQFTLYKTDAKPDDNSPAQFRILVNKSAYPSIPEDDRTVWFEETYEIPNYHIFLVDAKTGEAIGEGDTCLYCE